ncbi:acyl transferase [Aquirufa sp. A-Brett2-15D]
MDQTIESWREKLKRRVLHMQESDFEALALEVFRFQATFNPLYHQYINLSGVDPEKVNHWTEIPFLPIELFKNHQVLTGSVPVLFSFESSGTTGQIPSKHPVCDPKFYQEISKIAFEQEYGPLSDYHIFALLPSYLERTTSSLVFMMDHFIQESGSDLSGFYLNQYEELADALRAALATEKKVWLMGVTFGLLDLVDSGIDLSFLKEHKDRLIVMETGGMKGRREEWIRDKVHAYLQEKMGLDSIASEYGMTELFSQGHAKAQGIFTPAYTMRVCLREVSDPFTLVTQPHKTGGIKIADLGNIDSCSFIETRDLGSLEEDGIRFKVLGRFDNSEMRGCSLMVSGMGN